MKRKPQNDLERLSNAIINAILRSEEVKGIISRLQGDALIQPEDVFALALKFPTPGVMEARMGRINQDDEAGDSFNEETFESEENDDPPFGQFIDGLKLNEKEIKFQEFLARRFDESGWMKGARLAWEEPGG